MSAAPARPPRRRPRRGSLERPVGARTYRGTWLLVALPMLLAAFSVTRPTGLPSPQLPPAFDVASAGDLASELATDFPDRSRGSGGAAGAAQWFAEQLQPYGFRIRYERFEADVPGLGTQRFANVYAVVPGRSTSTIVVMAHRDNSGRSAGANDNGSGTAALIELARSYANPAASSSAPSSTRRVSPAHTLVFLSTDGAVVGGAGARWFADHSPLAEDVVAVVNLDSIGGAGPPRLELAGDRPRSPSISLVATAATLVLDQSGTAPQRSSALRQMIDLGFPFSFYEQAPFVGDGISAVTLTSAGDRPPTAFGDTSVKSPRLGQIGRASQQLLASLDEGLELTQGTSTYVYLGSRVIPGWSIELVLIASLLPFLAAAVDLFALCRRRQISLTPAFRSYRSRLAFWIWIAAAFEALGLLGFWSRGDPLPPPPEESVGTDWPVAGLIVLGALTLAGWLVARERLLPRREIRAEEELAGHAVALLVLGVLGLLVVAVNPFALIFLLPSLHAWIWLPQLRGRSLPTLATLAAGFLGPALLIWSFAIRLGLGLDGVWYLGQLTAIGYVPLYGIVFSAVWAAAGAQFAALSAGRYAPYPTARERPPLGPIRRVVRRFVLSSRAQTRLERASERRPHALEG